MTALTGWHLGEKQIQRRFGFESAVAHYFTSIEGEMPEQHRVFYTTRLPFIPITTLDEHGRPWTSIAAGPSGQLGFTSSPHYTILRMKTILLHGDPLEGNAKLFGKGKMLIAGIGIEFSSRRRNKFAGHVTSMSQEGDTLSLDLEVNEAIGNCPKYINYRDLIPHPDIRPTVSHRNLQMTKDDRLPDELIEFIHASDTVFLGTSYKAKEVDETYYPSHLGQNQRGGRQGFVRVKRSDGRTIVLPDYSGNRMLTSLGNIEATPLASLTFVSFTEGHILYLTGDARTLVGAEAQAVMPRQNVVTTLHLTGFVLIRDGLTVRQRPDTEVGRSPYSPPIRLLSEDLQGTSAALLEEEVSVTLSSIEMHSNNLATFTWEASQPLLIQSGQTAVMDFKELLGTAQYAHMAPLNPASVNDDRIRTWTVSHARVPPEHSTQFALTMREKKGGTVTGALFAIARKLGSQRPELLKNSLPLELRVNLVGIVGEFTLPSPTSTTPKSLLWVAGGIGITPFLSMLSAITSPSAVDATRWDVVLVISTREPEVLSSLILRALQSCSTTQLHLTVDIFSKTTFEVPEALVSNTLKVLFRSHIGRVDTSFLAGVPEIASRTSYLCGPPAFERTVLTSLAAQGVNANAVKREGFEY